MLREVPSSKVTKVGKSKATANSMKAISYLQKKQGVLYLSQLNTEKLVILRKMMINL